jgi:hypothetical protein
VANAKSARSGTPNIPLKLEIPAFVYRKPSLAVTTSPVRQGCFGRTAFTPMPCGPSSRARVTVMASTVALAQLSRRFGSPSSCVSTDRSRSIGSVAAIEDDETRKSNQTRKNMRVPLAVLCFLAGMVVQDASAAVRLKHIPPCPEGVVEEKVCRCQAFVSHRYNVCVAGQHCLRNAFHGMCL